MDFSKILSVASENKRHAEKGSKVKRYTTEVSAPKKPPKSNVQSDAVKAFLARKAAEERRREIEAEKQKRELLELRGVARHKRKANAMTRRTKDNNFMAGFLIKPEGNPTLETANWKSPPRPGPSNNTPQGRILKGDKRWVEVPRNAPAPPQPAPPDAKPKTKPAPPPANYHDLLKLAYKKQFDPVDDPIPRKKEVLLMKAKEEAIGTGEPMRLMRKDEKQRYLEEQARKSGKPLPIPSTEPLKNKSSIPANKKPENFRIPSLKESSNAQSTASRGNGSGSAAKGHQVQRPNAASKVTKSEPLKRSVAPNGKQPSMPNGRTQGGSNGTGAVKKQPAPVSSIARGALKPTASPCPGPQRKQVPLGPGPSSTSKKVLPSRTDITGKSVNKMEHNKLNSTMAKRQPLPKCPVASTKTAVAAATTSSERNLKVLKQAKVEATGGSKRPLADCKPRVFPPVEPRQFPPRDMMKRAPPPSRPPLKRRIESDEDDEMADFIDDTPVAGSEDYSKHIRDIFGYDRRRFQFNEEEEEEEARFMESSFVEQMREEARSARLGLLEDLEDIQREEEELKQELLRRKKKKK